MACPLAYLLCVSRVLRCSLASLLTIALHGKLEYYTSIMKDLLVDLIDASASKNPKLMLRRTESVVEKMLTNWMSICMYSYLKASTDILSSREFKFLAEAMHFLLWLASRYFLMLGDAV